MKLSKNFNLNNTHILFIPNHSSTMSAVAQPKRLSRPVKPKIASVPKPVIEAPVAVPTPAVVVTPEVPAESTEVASQKTRTQTSKAIGVSISSARVRRHIDKLNLNSVIDQMINELKSRLAPYKTAKSQLETGKTTHMVEYTKKNAKGEDVKKLVEESRDITESERTAATKLVADMEAGVPAIESQIAALSRERTRFSNEASIVLSIVCDETVQQLVEHAMDRALAAKKKIIQVPHLHEAGVEKLSLFPLIKNLPSFVATADKLAKTAQEESAAAILAAALTKAEKDFKKKYEIKTPKKKKEPEVAQTEEVVEPAADEEDPSDSKTSFKFYVHQVCKELVKRDEKFKAIRISTDIRTYLSNLLVEFIQRVSPLVLLMSSSMKNKTVNDVAILKAVECLLIDGHHAVESVEVKPAQVHDPVALKAELAKRDEEKKAGREYKVVLDSIPKIDGFVAVRTIKYPTSGYSALEKKVQKKISLYEALSVEKPVEEKPQETA
jgi:histone H3/H4